MASSPCRRLRVAAEHVSAARLPCPDPAAAGWSSAEPQPRIRGQFDTFGYFVERGLYTPAEVASFHERYESEFPPEPMSVHGSADRKNRGPATRYTPGFPKGSPFRDFMLDNPRVLDRIEDCLGTDFLWLTAATVRFGGETPWHWDYSPEGGNDYPRVKVIMYLDDLSTPGNGSLGLIPGSHYASYRQALRQTLRREPETSERDGVTIGDELGAPVWGDELTPLGVSPLEVPCVQTLTSPADIVFFNPLTFHSSFGASNHLPGNRPGGKRTFQLIFGKAPGDNDEWMKNIRGLVGTRTDHPEKVMLSTHAQLAQTARDPRLRRAAQWIVDEVL